MAKKAKKGAAPKSQFPDEESRRRYLQDIKDKAKEKQALEEKNAHLNRLKIHNRWREIMKAAKAQELSSQISTLKQVHERHLDAKSAGITNLAHDVAEAESQFSTALQSHCSNVDTLIHLQSTRLHTLQHQFEGDLGVLEAEFITERVRLQAGHVKERADILGIMGRMEQDFQDAEADARHEYSSLRDDVKNKNLEEKHALRIQLEGTVEELWRQFQAALNQYNAATEERKKQFEELKLKDAKNAKEIEQQMRKLVKLQETISHIKSRLLLNAKENDERTRTLKSDKELIQHHFQHLKRQMNSFREKERRKLTELTILSNKAIKELKGKVEQAEKIIRLAEMNRKLETEEEKIVPFYRESEGLEGEGEGVQSTPHLPPELSSMTSFHKRYNKVNLDRQALEKQRAQLQEENLHLRGILKQYLDGISVNESVLEMPNPLLVVNGRTNAPMRHPQSRLNVTYVEAAHHQQLGIISGPIGVN